MVRLYKIECGVEYYYSLPGLGYNGSSYYRSALYHNASSNKVIHNVTRANGPDKVYSGIKIIRVYANNGVVGGRCINSTGGLDFTNYEVVRNYYNLPK